MYREKIVNISTGEESFRDYTKEEIAEIENNKAIKAQQASEENKRLESRQALLNRLGLTEEEAKLLLG